MGLIREGDLIEKVGGGVYFKFSLCQLAQTRVPVVEMSAIEKP